MLAYRLPTSGVDVVLREPAGAEDALLAEAVVCDTALATALLSSLAKPQTGEAMDWGAAPIGDIDAALLSVRRLVLGDLVRADIVCPAAGCGERIDVAFRVSEYLTHHAPRAARGVVSGGEPGWFRLADLDVSFRLPSGSDMAMIAREEEPVRALAERCIRPIGLPSKARRRVEAAMEALAPCLSGELDAVCAECATSVRVAFDPTDYVLRELREQACFVFEEVDILARRYRWAERDILALPRRRRARYVDLAQAERGIS